MAVSVFVPGFAAAGKGDSNQPVDLASFVASPGVSAAGGSAVLFRVNAGGALVAATDAGPDWAEDTAANPSAFHNTGANAAGFAVSSVDGSVPATTPIAVFSNERWDPAAAPEMAWTFPVGTPGTYEVRLYFANGCGCTQNPGQRSFDVSIEGAMVLDDYDIAADVGHLTGTMKSFLVSSDADLNIDFAHNVENPLISAIEILALNSDGLLTASPGALNFGLVEMNTVSSSQSVTLTNLGSPGDSSITLTGAVAGGEFVHDLTLQSLPPGAAVVFNVTFQPTVIGAVAETLTITHDGTNPSLVIDLAGEGYDPAAAPINFSSSNLQGETVNNPTSLDFGPDDRLYVSQQDGALLAYTIVRNSPTDYQITATETIPLVQNIPNHDDDGTLNTGITNRQVTGLVAAGTPAAPVLYVSSSDPRIGAGGGGNDLDLDTNSGIVSRLTWNGAAWEMVHLVRGLPRSEENHASNGMALDPVTQTLYLMQGGHANKGAPSNNFAQTPEYALSAAMLSIDLAIIDAMPTQVDAQGHSYKYDLPTLDDPLRAGDPDSGDPFGGNDGRNQAIVVTGGPVQVYSPGYRNAYDVVRTQAGRLYTFDNGPNSGWGGLPVGEGTPACNNDTNEADSTGYGDGLHFVSGPGHYGGHPHPTRANPETSGLYIYENVGGTWTLTEQYDWQIDFPVPPVPLGTGNVVECDYLIPGAEDGALAVITASTNGIAEYSATSFGSAMQGDLLAASFNGNVYRFQLNAAGDGLAAPEEALLTGFGAQPLDVTAQGDGEVFPGTIWVAVYGSDNIAVFEPIDFGSCSGAYDPALDEDGDGYDNADEIDNGTDPCSGGSKPTDNDGDFISDLNDPDDDNDGTPDVDDAFAIDPDNGTTTGLPILYPLFNADPGSGFFGLGFTGLMTNGATDYLNQFDETTLAAGGAAGLFTVEQVSAGDAHQANNSQDNGFQFGVNVDTGSSVFSVQTRLLSPYFEVDGSPSTPANFQAYGLQIGTGDQDNYLKIVLNAQGGAGGIEVLLETAGVAAGTSYPVATTGDVLNSIFLDLYLTVDPVALTVQPHVALDGAPLVDLGAPLAIPAAWLDPADAQGLAVGVISTSFGSGVPFGATWDLIEVTPGPAGAECAVNGDCDDGNDCTDDVCATGLCRNDPSPAATTCEQDGDLCTLDECDGLGVCANAGVVGCPMFEICNPSSGVCEPSTADTDNDGLPDSTDPCPGDPRNLCFGPVAQDAGTATEIRINASAGIAGSGARVDCNGDTWHADFGFNQGLSFQCNLAGGCPITGLDALFGIGCEGDAATQDIFRSERYDEAPAPALVYGFDVPDGLYLVNLLFANTWTGSVNPGDRVFDILIEGALVYDDFDQVAAAAGSGIAVVRSASISVTDGNGLQIEFQHLVQNPAIKGLEVLTTECIIDDDCDDGNGCTADTCNAGTCENTPEPATTSCDLDGNACTLDECDGLGTCGNVGNVTCDPGDSCLPPGGSCEPDAGDFDNDGLTNLVDPCPTQPLNECFGQVAQDGTELVDLRINTDSVSTAACSGAKLDCRGALWIPDFGAPESTSGYNVAGNASTCNLPNGCPVDTAAVFGCFDALTEDLFQCEHWDPATSPELSYFFNLPDGNYLVNLLFMNTFTGTTTAGSRVFSVSVNGVVPTQLLDFDQVVAAGAVCDPTVAPCIPVVRSALVTVSGGGGLTLEFLHNVENTAIKGIEVLTDAECTIDVTCDDGDPCTVDTCSGGICQAAPEADTDADGVCDALDNCPGLANAGQEDADMDALGDVCDACPDDSLNDVDADGVCADLDNCPFDGNPSQSDGDADGLGDVCDLCANVGGAAEITGLGAGVWETRASNTIARHEGGLVAVGGSIYLIGGDNQNSVEIYDIATNTWSAGPTLPAERNHTQPVVVGTEIYVIGGLTGFPGPSVDTVLVLDTLDLGAGWQARTPMPTVRGALGCSADGIKIYCAGGLSSVAGDTAVDVMEVYNTVSDSWSTLAPMPRVRDHFQSEIIDGKFYAASGRDTTIAATFAFVDVYDIATDSWTTVAPLPTPRGGYASAVLNGRLLIIGGEGGGPSMGTFPDVEEYDPALNSWRALAGLPTPRHGMAAALSSFEDGVTQRLYVISGGPAQGGSNSAVNEVFHFDTDCDQDGVTIGAGDCDDVDPTSFPGGTEVCDGLDNDCSGVADDGIPPPAGPGSMLLSAMPGATQLGWSAVPGAETYDVVRGDLLPLRSSVGDFTASTTGCLGSNLVGTTVLDPDLPASEESYYYLLRGVNCTGAGTYDSGGSGQQGGRDVEVNAAPPSCP